MVAAVTHCEVDIAYYSLLQNTCGDLYLEYILFVYAINMVSS